MSEYLGPIPMQTAGERIAERIVTAIALGEFVPDQRLPTERELAAALEVSRTTVREALQRLQAGGYVSTRRGRNGGTFVRTGIGSDADAMIRRTLVPAWQELTEVLDFRRLIEQTIARTAAQRRDDNDIAAIRAAVEDYERAPDRDRPPGGQPRLRRRTLFAPGQAASGASAPHAGRSGDRRGRGARGCPGGRALLADRGNAHRTSCPHPHSIRRQ
jgi:DNA-binding FadR family transcriptional regulator